MSFLLNALGNLGRNFLGSASSFLGRVASPVLSRVGGFFSNMLGGDSKQGLGRSAMDSLVNRGINATMDGVQKFAQSDWLQRKVPILAPALGNAAEALRGRLSQGYQNIMNGETPGAATMAQSVPMDGVERQ